MTAPAVLPLQKRLETLVQHTQFAWWTGHLLLLLASLRYAVAVLRFSASSHTLAYRTAFFSAIFAYSVVIYKTYARAGVKLDIAGLTRVWLDENVQYLLLALVFFRASPIFFALLPFAIFSFFHFVTYLRSNVLPAIAPTALTAQTTPAARLAQQIQYWVKVTYEPAMSLVAKIEVLALGARILFGALTFRTSWSLLFVYLHFLRFRYFTSAYTRQTFTHLSLRIDHLLAAQNCPPALTSAWHTFKRFVAEYATTPIINTSAAASAAVDADKQEKSH